MFNIEEYHYGLPEELIAQVPAASRDGSRLLFVKRRGCTLSDHCFSDLPGLLEPGDLLVVNNTRVVPARLFGRKESGGQVEVLVLEHANSHTPARDTRWCLSRSSKRPRSGTRLFFENGMTGLVEEVGDDGLAKISFRGAGSIDALLDERGMMPLPPYIKRGGNRRLSALDRERYQTVFSKERGAVAAPTAGLHFTAPLVETLEKSGISLVELTLHVGHGTFRPVRAKDIRHHELGEEHYIVERDTAETVNRSKRSGGRIIAVGTTVVRTLETLAGPGGKITPGRGKTDLLITPGFRFKAVDGMITNFHLPRSSLLFLVSAFAGIELTRKAYQWAIEKAYRFYSYGDAMLIL
jgi:S-adenosylmethionine:tRNA ribosyltransferase-isomerase